MINLTLPLNSRRVDVAKGEGGHNRITNCFLWKYGRYRRFRVAALKLRNPDKTAMVRWQLSHCIHNVLIKNTHFCFLLYLLGKWSDLHKNFSKRSRENSNFSYVKIIELVNKYHLLSTTCGVVWICSATRGFTEEARYLIIRLLKSKVNGATPLRKMFSEKRRNSNGLKTE